MSSCYARRCLYTLGLVAAQTYLIDDRWMDYVNALMKRVLGLSSYLVQVSEAVFGISFLLVTISCLPPIDSNLSGQCSP